MSVPDRQTPGSYLFGQYEIVETLGQGGMGVVYKALDVALDRPVVLKVLREDLRHRPQIVARFRREAEAIAALDHPHIVHIYSVGEFEGIPYMAMEYVEAIALSELLERDGPMPWPRALEIGEQIAAALARAHEFGIIHRDVKPGNVLIDRQGKAYVTDFGIAKVLSAATQLTLEGQRLGTPQYMCPERCRGGEVTPLSDIYSLGVLLFQAISGRLPHEASTPGQLMQRIITEPAARLRKYLPDVPDDVDRLLAYLLEAKPQYRPQSAAVVVDAIARVRRGGPLSERDQVAGAIQSYQQSFNTPSVQTPTSAPAAAKRPAKKRLAPATLLYRLLLAGSLLAGASFGIVAVSTPAPEPAAPAQLWTEPPPVAQVQQETTAVSLARIALPEFSVSALSTGTQALAVQLDGLPASMRAGQRALVGLESSLATAVLLQAPVPDTGGQGFRLLPTSAPAAFLSRSSVTLQRTLSPDAAPSIFLPGNSTALALHPWKREAVVARFVGGKAQVSIVNPDTTATLAELDLPGPQVNQLAYAGDGLVLAFQTATSSAGRLHRLAWDGNLLQSEHTLDSAGPLGWVPYNASRNAVVVQRLTAEGDHVMLMDAGTGEPHAQLGTGAVPSWAPRGDTVLAIDTDRAARLQLFAIAAEPPHARRQLTFVDAGLEPLLVVDAAQECAFSALAGQPVVARVDLAN